MNIRKFIYSILPVLAAVGTLTFTTPGGDDTPWDPNHVVAVAQVDVR